MAPAPPSDDTAILRELVNRLRGNSPHPVRSDSPHGERSRAVAQPLEVLALQQYCQLQSELIILLENSMTLRASLSGLDFGKPDEIATRLDEWETNTQQLMRVTKELSFWQSSYREYLDKGGFIQGQRGTEHAKKKLGEATEEAEQEGKKAEDV